MNKLLLIFLAGVAILSGQTTAVRVDPQNAFTTAGNITGAQPPIIAQGYAAITVCNYPANGVPCTNLATTYQSTNESFPCPGNAQVVLGSSSSCQSTTDLGGRFGFWVAPGNYAYVITIGNRNFGPYPVTAGGGSGGGGGGTTYTAPYTGAVTQTIVNKLAQVVSIIDFGADPTGATDSSAAANNCLAVAGTSRGGVACYAPCGFYLFNSAVTLNLPNQSFVGENESCVSITLGSQASGIIFQMNPFTTNPAGVLANFHLTCNSATTNGILSGQIVGSHWENVDVTGCTGSGSAAGIHLHNAGDVTTWTERNEFLNVSTGGYGTGRNSTGWLLDSDNSADSFGYNRFLDTKINVSTGQTGFYLKSGFFYNSILTSICNAENNTTGSVGAICWRSGSNWDNNTITLNGESSTGGTGTGTQYSIQIDSGGTFRNLRGSGISALAPGGGQMPVNNLNAATDAPTQTVVEGTNLTSWDTGVYTLGSTTAVPQPIQRGSYGSLGLLIGANVESPYVTMFNATNNKFVVGSQNFGDNLGQMEDVFDVSPLGQVQFVSTLSSICQSWGLANCTSPGATDGNVTESLGGYTSADRSGLAELFLKANTGINEQEGFDPNFSNGIGSVSGTNINHPILWAYFLDPADLEIYEKPFQTPLANSDIAFQITHGGGIGQGTSARNIAGTCTLATASACSWTPPNARLNNMLCTGSPQFIPTAFYSVTGNTVSCTVTFSANQSGTFTFVTIGNPN